MSGFIFIQVAIDLFFLGAVVYYIVDKTRASKRDDARLSRGLQLLQNKLAVFQDLMDRSETFSQQMNGLIDRKAREVQEKIEEAAVQVQRVSDSIHKSQQVAQIFQDRIPHQEIIERQNTLKYVEAAKMAHSGVSIEEIQKRTQLSRGEIELIAKVNRDQLTTNMPEWAEPAQREPAPQEPPAQQQVQAPAFQGHGYAAPSAAYARELEQAVAASRAAPTAQTNTQSTPQTGTQIQNSSNKSSLVSSAVRTAVKATNDFNVLAQSYIGEMTTAAHEAAARKTSRILSEGAVSAIHAQTGERTTVYPMPFKKIERPR